MWSMEFGNYCHGLNVKKFPKIIQINQSEQESFALLKWQCY